MAKFSMTNVTALLIGLRHCHCCFSPDWVSPATSMENMQTRRSSSGSSQAGEGLAAQLLMARALRMLSGIRKMENIECRLMANGSPPDTLVTVSNKFGLAVVWPYKDYEGRKQIRCFIPGTGG